MTMSSASASPVPRFRRRRAIGALIVVAGVSTAAFFHWVDPPRAGGGRSGGGWFGELVGNTAGDGPAVAPLSSSSLVVPSTELALPPIVKTPLQVKRSCDSADSGCALRPLPVVAPAKRLALADAVHPLPPRRPTEPAKEAAMPAAVIGAPNASEKKFSLNPLDHLPDTAALGRPFVAAGSTISGWVKRL